MSFMSFIFNADNFKEDGGKFIEICNFGDRDQVNE